VHRDAGGRATRLENRIAVRAGHAVNVCFARMYHRLELRSPPRLPRSGPAILVCNHISGLDPVLIQATSRRIITWMMASEYYEIPALTWFFKQVGAIPVDRSGRDLAATRQAMRALDHGNILGVFPEGRIEPDRSLLPFQTGVAMIAIRKGVDVYPAAIEGTQRGLPMVQAFLNPQSAGLAFGERINLSGFHGLKPDLGAATAVLQTAVDQLRQEL
jgi:1-acyl-sn-glycerol-3-phosphate acyltransferase